MAGLELFETAVEDYNASLEHGRATMSPAERRSVERELEDAEVRAKAARSKQQDHYATLGACSGSLDCR